MKKKPRHSSASRSPTKRRTKNPDATDQALNCCRNIITLARLLETRCAEAVPAPVDETLIADTGGMIYDQARHLQELLHSPEF